MKGIILFMLFSFMFKDIACLLKLSNTLGDNMVLQRAPLQAVIFGAADANARITVTISGMYLCFSCCVVLFVVCNEFFSVITFFFF
jgi:hypothetical protein